MSKIPQQPQPRRPLAHRPPVRRSLAVGRGARALFAALLLVGLVALPGAGEAHAQSLEDTFSVALLGTVGGSLDAEPGDSLGNLGFQLNLAMVTEPQTRVTVRLGQLGLDDDELFGPLRDAELLYANIGGEYQYRHSYYDSGIFIGLGAYQLEGTDFAGQSRDETSLGAVLGVNGEFPINRWLGVQVEFSGHWVDFDEQQVFLMGHGGVIVHF